MLLAARWPSPAAPLLGCASSRRCIHSTAAAFSRKATRKALTGKMANKNYHKGKRTRRIGRNTKHGNYVVDAPVYPHARRSLDRFQELKTRLQTHPAYSGTEERLPTVDQQAFELSRLIIGSYRRFLGLPKLGAPPAPAPTVPMPKDATELAYAAKRGRLDQVEKLLEAGGPEADIGATDSAGRTALHYAAMYGHGDVVAELLDKGAEDAEDGTGTLAVTLAAASSKPGSLAVVAELLEMRDSVFSLTRTPEGFGIDLDRRGAIVGYTGVGRPAEAASVPLGAVVAAVDDKEVRRRPPHHHTHTPKKRWISRATRFFVHAASSSSSIIFSGGPPNSHASSHSLSLSLARRYSERTL